MTLDKDYIMNNMIETENGLNYQNLEELDSDQTVIEILDYFENGGQSIITPYWTYIFKNENSVKNAVGKWWVRGGQGFKNLIKEAVESGLVEYGKWPTKKSGVVCFYTTEENIVKFAEWIKEKHPDLYEKNISYKYDIDTIKGGQSKFKIQDKA